MKYKFKYRWKPKAEHTPQSLIEQEYLAWYRKTKGKKFDLKKALTLAKEATRLNEFHF